MACDLTFALQSTAAALWHWDQQDGLEVLSTE